MPDDPPQERQQEGQHDMQAHQSDEDPATRKVDRKLLEILVCPLTKTTLQYDAKAQELISPAAKLAYPIRGGIPILLEEEARRLED